MGLEFSFKKLMTVGGTAVIASITIVSGMMFLGYTAGNALGFSHLSSIFLGGMLSMSSTAIVFKAFDDMGLRGQKFTGVVLGVLVVEDLVAVVFDGLAFNLSSQQASRRNGNAGKYSKVRSVSYILVITRNLSDSKFS